jgi:hypothetical protein
MNQSLIIKSPLDKARRDLDEATEAMRTYWSRSISDSDGQMTDVRASVEALTRAIASVSLAVERHAELVVD